MNVSSLHADGILGQGVIVGVIDSGIRPGFPHIDLDGSVIGCEDFVGDALGCSHVDNSGHGTFVAGMISANVVFAFNPASTFFQAIQTHAPGAIIPPNLVPMLGSAPLSSIYAFRVFGPVGGSPTSRILAAIDRLIELRDLFDWLFNAWFVPFGFPPGLVFQGTPEQVTAQIREMHQALGFRELFLWICTGLYDHQVMMRQLELFDRSWEKDHKLLRAVDSIREKYGRRALRRAGSMRQRPLEDAE
ncbi:MAG: hypothetical protein IH789_02780 [Acidobacteria bacterium]|nr:hypothetical protein [Acidobacteriota bacterium]